MATCTWDRFLVRIFVIFCLFLYTLSLPEQGIWVRELSEKHNIIGIPKSLYNQSTVALKIQCHSKKATKIKIQWLLRQSPCGEEYIGVMDDEQRVPVYFSQPDVNAGYDYTHVSYFKSDEEVFDCANDVILLRDNSIAISRDLVTSQVKSESKNSTVQSKTKRSVKDVKSSTQVKSKTETGKIKKKSAQNLKKKVVSTKKKTKNADQYNTVDKDEIARTWEDGIYLFILKIRSQLDEPFNATVTIWMKSSYGYLSAKEWPLLPFYGVMCGVYVILGIIWLVLSACNWRDLLRIQFWIGGVIIFGMLEKAVFYSEYQTINFTGNSVRGAIIFAELVSCAKRTLARMLVIIVSLGFGIVKPRLGSMLHRVLLLGGLYFILAAIEGCLRTLKPKGDTSNQQLIASIPLALIDVIMCWWIFTSLVQTVRTLRLRRNLVKLSLYRHFTNTLIFAVIASICFMIWSIMMHKLVTCLKDWKELWVDDAFWHILFSVILIVIMVLWRPTNNNQRYAFSPLLDAADDEDEEPMLNEAYEGMKMRSQINGSPKQRGSSEKKTEDDLKWIEENIPSSVADSALPTLLDSDEEIMTTKFEMSKME